MSLKIFILSVIALFLYNIPGMLTAAKTPKYIGCFKDKKTRGLEKSFGKLGSVSDCVNKCREAKLNYAGLQYGGYCFCGNKYDKYGKASKCNRKCKSGEICGGSWANSVYEVPLHYEISLIGCYKASSIGLKVGGVLSIEHCLMKCRKMGFAYAGIRESSSCSCGVRYNRFRKSTACTMKCISQQEPCGGKGASSIYKVFKLPENYKQEGYLGCYKEDKSNRVMSEPRDTVTSVWACTKLCNETPEMKYAGLIANGKNRMCYCGTSYEKYGKSTDCNKKCRSGEICGGESSLSVFKLLKPFETAERIGCFKEGNPRKLSKKIGFVPSIEKCFEKCVDHKYLAIENGRDCYCGNDYPKSSTSNQCKKECSYGKICGGKSAISVFKVVLMDV